MFSHVMSTGQKNLPRRHGRIAHDVGMNQIGLVVFHHP
jgi:hypothetical protein